jgi:flagellar motor switch protein FliG
MLARYKRNNQSMMELVKLIEESSEPKRSNLMNMVMQEDAEFGAKIQRRLFDWDKLKALNENLIAEIISACPPKILALALYQESEDFLKMAERCLGNKFSEYKAEKEVLAERPPGEAQVDSARRKMVSEARKLEADGAFKLMDYDKLDALGGASSGSALGAVASAGPVGTASAEAGAPSVDSFKMDPPPPGLLGERFEEYVKRELGIK